MQGAQEQDRVVGERSTRAAAVRAWSLAAASLVLLLAAVRLSYLNRSAGPASVDGPNWLDYGFTVMVAAYLTVGALVASRRPRNAVGWLLCAVGLATAVEAFTDTYRDYAEDMDLAGAEAASCLYAVNPGALLAIFVPLVFPDGRLPSRRWRPLLLLVVASVVVYVVDAALEPGGPDPLGVELPSNVYEVLVVVGIVSLIVGILGAATSVALRLWRARGQERQQLKWLVYATSVVVIGALGAVLLPPPLGDVFYGVMIYGFAGMPVAVGVAILRYRLYDIDLVINRTLVYGSLSVLLAATYYGSVAVLQGVFRALTGGQSTLAVVASTLAIAALFVPLRRRIQGFIDRVFYRRRYDAAKTLEAFSATLRDETDLEALSDDLVGVVREAMQPAHVSLWLRPETSAKGEQTG
ncbi:MAG TPA: hypothetical protein VK902_12420 [Rubrobacter sp.]|nr:hypothetical protein [Rubrobacter sp.]